MKMVLKYIMCEALKSGKHIESLKHGKYFVHFSYEDWGREIIIMNKH